LFFQGGFSTGRRVEDNCDIVAKVDNPSLLYCHRSEPLYTLVKGYGSYTIPKVDVVFSATYQTKPGPIRTAVYTAANAEVSQSLGRNLAAGAASTVDINLVSPGAYVQQDNAGLGSLHGDRIHQVDMRISKLLHFGGTKARANIDIYNALNSSAVISENATYTDWLRPTEILIARFFKFSVQFDF
jgi:hypothetical protein